MNRSIVIKFLIIILLDSTNLDAMIDKSAHQSVKKEPNQEQTLPQWLQKALELGAEPINFYEVLKNVKIPDVYYDEAAGFLQLKDQQKLFENKFKDGITDGRGVRRSDYYALSKQTWADKPVMVFYALRVKADFAGEDFLVPGVGVKGFIFVFQGHDEKFFLNRELFDKDFFEDSMGYCIFSWHARAGQHGGVHIDKMHGDEKYEKKELKKFIFNKLFETLQSHNRRYFWMSASDGVYSKTDAFRDSFRWRKNVIGDPMSGMQHHIFPEGAHWLYVMPGKKS